MTNEAYDYHNRDTVVPTQDFSVVAAPATQEPDVQEHANMIKRGFEHILNKALEASDLARKVKELEDAISSMGQEVASLRGQLHEEQRAHGETAKVLQQVQSTLAQRESTVHDLVMERDIALEERNGAQRDRDDQRRQTEAWEYECKQAQAALNQERERNDVLNERCNAMQLRVNAVKEALNGLHSL